MKTSTPLVVIIDHHSPTVSALRRLLLRAGYRLSAFPSLQHLRPRTADLDAASCAIVDLDLPRSGGLSAQTFLAKAYPGLPVIFVARHPSVASSVEAIKAGALDLVVAPFDEERLLKLVHTAVIRQRRSQTEREELADIGQRLNTLTRREAEVLERLLRGLLNKQTAAELGTSEKTIKVHRGRIMKKMQVQSIAQLVQLVLRVRGSGSPSRPRNVPPSASSFPIPGP
ncbi:MAG TPA: LuxR C-terminal-related transcriptional regulator [Verrucomicrobiae bacterium]|nr:LuxR C-terminal-related transcriptional regulator [Verrucomicrobiae bacterium]